jgi:hypothetical protein
MGELNFLGTGLTPEGERHYGLDTGDRFGTARNFEYASRNSVAAAEALHRDPENKALQAKAKLWKKNMEEAGVSWDAWQSAQAGPNPDVDYRKQLPKVGNIFTGFQAGYSRAETIEEKTNYLNKKLGPTGWMRDTGKQLLITAEGQRKLGLVADLDSPPIPLNSRVVLNAADAALQAKDFPAIAGGTLASILAPELMIGRGVAGWLGRAALPGLGAAGGKALDEAGDALRGENRESATEVAGGLGKEFLTATAGDAIGGLVQGVGRKALRPNVGGAPADALEKAQQLGLHPTLNSMTGGGGVLGFLEGVQKGIFGNNKIDMSNAQQAHKAVGDIGDQIRAEGSVRPGPLAPIERVPGGSTRNTTTEGMNFRADVEGEVDKFWQKSEGLYNPVWQGLETSGRAGQPLMIPMDDFAGQAKQMLDAVTIPGPNPGENAFVIPEDSIKKLTMWSQYGGAEMSPRDVHKMRVMMRGLGKDSSQMPGVAKRHFRKMKESLDDALEPGTIEKRIFDKTLIPPTKGEVQLLKDLGDANKYYHTRSKELEFKHLEGVLKDPNKSGGVSPEDVADLFFDGKKSGGFNINPSTITALEKVFSPQKMTELREIGWEKLSNVLYKESGSVGQVNWDPQALIAKVKQIGEPAMEAMYGKKVTKEITATARALQLTLGAATKNPGLAVASIALNPLAKFPLILRLGIVKHLMSSSYGRKYLTKGLLHKPKRRNPLKGEHYKLNPSDGASVDPYIRDVARTVALGTGHTLGTQIGEDGAYKLDVPPQAATQGPTQ